MQLALLFPTNHTSGTSDDQGITSRFQHQRLDALLANYFDIERKETLVWQQVFLPK